MPAVSRLGANAAAFNPCLLHSSFKLKKPSGPHLSKAMKPACSKCWSAVSASWMTSSMMMNEILFLWLATYVMAVVECVIFGPVRAGA